jgi:Predicted transcriptional regulators
MTIYDRIRLLAKKQGISVRELGSRLDIGETTIYKWKTQTPKTDILSKVADELHTSVDYLLGRTADPDDLSPAEKEDVGEQAEKLLAGLSENASANFFGEPMTDEQKIAMRSVIQTAMELNRKMAKKDDK